VGTTAEAFDVLLAAALVVLAWRALSGQRPVVCVVLFVVFGLLMALAWTRLDAPDIALAEAAIGAGVTGALLLDALGQLGREEKPRAGRRMRDTVAAALALALAVLLGIAVVALPAGRPGLEDAVARALGLTGVTHPTTAVLLDFRAWDTLLEVAVLVAAALAVLALLRRNGVAPAPAGPADPVLAALPRVVVPAALLAAGYLLWLGTSAPGGAFQAGAVLAAAGILLRVAGPDALARLSPRGLAALLAVGLAVFLAVGIAAGLAGRGFLDYPPAAAGPLVVLVESAVAVSVGVTLAALFALAATRAAAEEGGGP
jgi:multisubunit Na+/H+ antiporter MnhB subunit